MHLFSRGELVEECASQNVDVSMNPARADMLLAIRAQVDEQGGQW